MKQLATAIVIVCAATAVQADTVDFENAADFGGDDAAITSSYFAKYGLQIKASAGSSESTASEAVLAFEATGRDNTDAFWSATAGGRDEARSGSLGNFFVKAGTKDLSYSKSKFFKMSIAYDDATAAASAEVWDIDGPEQYKVTALDSNGTELASVTSPTGGLDGEPWAWSFDVGKNSISQIDVEFVGSSNLRGFAFDNFNATGANPNATTHAAPLPVAWQVGLVGLFGNAFMRRKRRQREVTAN